MTEPQGRPPSADPSWHERVTEALSTISDAVCCLDADDRFSWLNPSAERLLDRRLADLVGRSVWEVFPDLVGTDLQDAFGRARTTGGVQQVECCDEHLDRWLEGRVLLDHRGELVVFFRDVHERPTPDEEPVEESSLLRAVLNALPARTAILDPEGRILTTNAAWCRGATARGRPYAARVGADYLEACRTAGAAGDQDAVAAAEGLGAVLSGQAPSFSLDYALAPREGRAMAPTWWHLQAFPVDDRPRVVVSHTDITDRVTAEQRAAWQARHDHLTSLPNRAALHEAIADAMAESASRPVTVLYMDIDGFKQVNDTLGHSAGDLLLQELASRLTHRTRPTDLVGRLGGDEFVVVARNCDAGGGDALARRFRSVFDEPFELGGSLLPLTASIGIAASGPAHTRPDDLLRDADAAMYAAKASGRNRHLTFTPALRTELDDRWQIASRLREAAAQGEFTLAWQPVVHLATGEVTSCEALLRWNHPQRGLVAPTDFIPVAEENGLIVPITRWLLQVTAAQCRAWTEQGLHLSIAVNVSAVHLSSGTLIEDVLGAVAAAELPAEQVVLELTETSLARNPSQATRQLSTLRDHGVQIAIDDFGTGYSSLSAVASLPADVLKVDRTLVSGPATSIAAPEAVLRAVAALGSALGMQVLAEGVETPGQLDLARSVGCTFAQGHHLSPPLPAEELGTLLTEARRRTGRQCLPPPEGGRTMPSPPVATSG
jgi:diguanylate cyclase (GGDEF)-like protein